MMSSEGAPQPAAPRATARVSIVTTAPATWRKIQRRYGHDDIISRLKLTSMFREVIYNGGCISEIIVSVAFTLTNTIWIHSDKLRELLLDSWNTSNSQT